MLKQILALLKFLKMKFINSIKSKDIFDFKESYCDENTIISSLLRNTLKNYIKPPILDVGAGIGDISYRAFDDKKVIMIDVNNISKHDYPCRPTHFRRRADFFEFESKEQIKTLLISHTLQFIDNDIEMLNEKVKEIGPENIILIINTNDGFMKEVIEWTYENFDNPNPEVKINGFPEGYNLVKSQPFTATLKCNDFETLALQIAYLMLIEIDTMMATLISFLKRKLGTPTFEINQAVEIYKKA